MSGTLQPLTAQNQLIPSAMLETQRHIPRDLSTTFCVPTELLPDLIVPNSTGLNSDATRARFQNDLSYVTSSQNSQLTMKSNENLVIMAETQRSCPVTTQPILQTCILNSSPQAPVNSAKPPTCLLSTPVIYSTNGVKHQTANMSLIATASELNDDATNESIDDTGSVCQMGGSNSTNMSSLDPQSMILAVRLLMSGKEVGSIIGKRGENVKRYREESGARINISDGSSPERIVTVTGTTDQIFIAFSLMSQKFEDDFTQGLLRMGDDGFRCPPITLRLLVAATQCGSLIGKGGSRIKDVRELTGAAIQVASEALPTSTERTVTISGTAEAIANCIRHLCGIFIECPVKGPVVPYRPKPAFTNSNNVFTTSSVYPGMAYVTGSTMATTTVNSSPSLMSGTMNGCLVNHANIPPNEVESALNSPSNPHAASMLANRDLHKMSSDGLKSQIPMDRNVPLQNGHTMDRGNLQDLLLDPLHLSSIIDYVNPASQQLTILNNLNPGLFGNSTVSAPLLNPMSPTNVGFPEIGLNQQLLNFYSPQLCPSVNPANLFYTSPNGFLKSQPQRSSQNNDSTALQHSGADVSTDGKLHLPMTPGDLFPTANNQSIPFSSFSPNGFINPNGFFHPHLPTDPSFPNNTTAILGLRPLDSNNLIGAAQSPVISGQFPLLPPDSCSLNLNETVIREMFVPNELIGCIIGRGGTMVNEIRNVSRAQIKISNCEDGSRERKITLSGPLHAVHLAYHLINSSLFAHQQTWAFNFQLASAATALMTTSQWIFKDSSPISIEHQENCNQAELRNDELSGISNNGDISADHLNTNDMHDFKPKIHTYNFNSKHRRTKFSPY